MTRAITHVLVSFLLLGLVTSCKTAYEILESGDYDRAIDQSIRKIRGKKKKKEEFVMIIEHAFQKATEEDMRRAQALRADDDPRHWEQLHAIYEKIDRRQEKIDALLPLTSKNGYRAAFQFVKVEPLLLESRKGAAAYLYATASDLMEGARAGDKLQARSAYDHLLRLDYYFQGYLDKDALADEALDLGRNHVYLEIVNNSPTIMRRDFEEALLSISLDGLNSRWVQYHLRQPEQELDYTVIMNIRDIDVSPERYKENRYTESREIEDGWQYVLDENGNVAKDTLGNDIREPRRVTVSAEIRETCQIKEAVVSGSLDFFDHRSSRLLKSENLSSEAVFEHFTSNYRGDERALTDRGRRYLAQQLIPFPSDEDIVYDAALGMKPEMKEYLRRHKRLFEN